MGVLGKDAFFAMCGEFEEEEIFENADVFFVAVVGRTFIFSFFAIDQLHFLAET